MELTRDQVELIANNVRCAGMDSEANDIDAHDAALRLRCEEAEKRANDYDAAHGYLSRLFLTWAPQCEVMPTLTGLATQIDNATAKAMQRNPVLEKGYADQTAVVARREAGFQASIDQLNHRVADLTDLWDDPTESRARHAIIPREPT